MVHAQVMLVYTEAILIAQYIYQIPTRLHCAAITPQVALAMVPNFMQATLLHVTFGESSLVCR